MKPVLLFALTFQMPIQLLIGDWINFHYFNVVVSFFMIPILDHLLVQKTDGFQGYNQDENESLALEWIPRAWGVLHWIVLFWGIRIILRGELSSTNFWGLCLSIGLFSGGGSFVIAHELGHRKHWMDVFLCKAFLSSVFYSHFLIEHNIDHHKNVATPKDPATARLGETLYQFVPRSIFSGLRNAWGIENERLRKNKLSILSHRILWGEITSLILYFLVYRFLGQTCVLFLIVQSVVGIFILETINYVQHYGLRRKKLSSGKYEPVNQWHSWNTNNLLTNHYLLRLPYHSTHHQHPSYPYYQLDYDTKLPTLPTGYGGIIPLTLIPFLWFRIMNPKVKQIRKLNWSCRRKL